MLLALALLFATAAFFRCVAENFRAEKPSWSGHGARPLSRLEQAWIHIQWYSQREPLSSDDPLQLGSSSSSLFPVFLKDCEQTRMSSLCMESFKRVSVPYVHPIFLILALVDVGAPSAPQISAF